MCSIWHAVETMVKCNTDFFKTFTFTPLKWGTVENIILKFWYHVMYQQPVVTVGSSAFEVIWKNEDSVTKFNA